MKKQKQTLSDTVVGTLYAITAFMVWGILPIYWKWLKQVPADQILAHRIFWSFIFLSLILSAKGRWHDFRQTLRTGKNRFLLVLSAVIIGVNWFTYIWAVNSNQIVETSMGYYINPLLVVILALLVLRERMNFWQYVAFGIAAIGVVIMTMRYGRIPWIALVLAVSFGLYGLLKKLTKVDSLIGLTVETLLLAPFCFGYIIFRYAQGTGAFGTSSLTIHLLLLGAGIVTALPLVWFAMAAQRVPLARVGFTQYLAPTLQLMLGVLLYKEPFTSTHAISFGFIWAALVLYSFSHSNFLQKRQPAYFLDKSEFQKTGE